MNRLGTWKSSTGRNKLAASRQVCMDLRAPAFHLSIFPKHHHNTTHYVLFSARTPERLSLNYDDPRYLRASIPAKARFRILGSDGGSDRCINERRTLACLFDSMRWSQ
jgi:hypothetical protein